MPSCFFLASVLLALIYYQTSVWVSTSLVVFGAFPILTFSICLHVCAWLLQFVGHYAFEGRAPALLDSLDQAFITAPLFVLLEIVFFLGYRKDFYANCMKQVEANIAEFKRQKKAN